MIAPGTHEAREMYERFRELVTSMVADQDKFDAPLVRMWVALGEALEAADDLYKWGQGMYSMTSLQKSDRG